MKLAKLTDKDLQRLCGQPIVTGVDSKQDVEMHVETSYKTRSSVRPKPDHKGRLPQSVSLNVSYELKDSVSSEDDKSPVAKKRNNMRPKCEPSSARIKADKFTTKPPPVIPLRRSTRNIKLTSDTPPKSPKPTVETPPSKNKSKASSSVKNCPCCLQRRL